MLTAMPDVLQEAWPTLPVGGWQRCRDSCWSPTSIPLALFPTIIYLINSNVEMKTAVHPAILIRHRLIGLPCPA